MKFFSSYKYEKSTKTNKKRAIRNVNFKKLNKKVPVMSVR